MGMVSFAIADAAREAGAVLACGVPVSEIVPGEGVTLEDGTSIRAGDRDLATPTRSGMLGMLDGQRGRRRLSASGSSAGRSAARWSSSTPRSSGCRTGPPRPARRGRRARRSTSPARWTRPSAPSRRCERGEPAVGFGEIYIQTGYDPSPAPEGKHLLSVFGQYAPYELAEGDWDSRRDEVARQFIDLIDRFAPGFEDCLVEYEVLGPPDIESRIGLTGGNIFQGEVTPDQMWEGRLAGPHPGRRASTCAAPPPIRPAA